jgi:hypothetical protein
MTKGFPTEVEAKQFAKAMLSEELKVIAGTLSPHQPARRYFPSSEIGQWIEDRCSRRRLDHRTKPGGTHDGLVAAA